jgi:hypothetical protein
MMVIVSRSFGQEESSEYLTTHLPFFLRVIDIYTSIRSLIVDIFHSFIFRLGLLSLLLV